MTTSPESDVICSSKGRVNSYPEKSFLLAVEDLDTRLRSGRMEAAHFP